LKITFNQRISRIEDEKLHMQERYKGAVQKTHQAEREVALLKNQIKQKDDENKEA
jgi:chromosome segregation ATPase